MSANPIIAGVALSKYPDDEIAFMPWMFLVGLSPEDQQAVLSRVEEVRKLHPEWDEEVKKRSRSMFKE